MIRKLLYLLTALMLVMPAAAQKTRSKQSAVATSKTQRNKSKNKTTHKANQKKQTTTYTNASIRGLQNQRAAIQKKIREQERALKANKENVSKRLQDLLVINTEIDEKQKSIDGIQTDIKHIDGNIDLLKSQLATLEQQLKERQHRYVKSMRYMARHRTVQDKLMFVFSAKNLAQMYRRLRFVREYADYQRAQGEMVKTKQAEVNGKHRQLEEVRGQKRNLLYKGQQARTELEGKKTEQQEVVKGLQNQQKTIQSIISQHQKQSAALNAQIDRLVAEEVAKARARAAAEAKRKAAAEAAAKKRAEELARRKAAAEAAARENARRIAEARAREKAAREKAEAAARAAAEERSEAEAREAKAREAKAKQQAREAQAAREAAERKAEVEAARNKKAIAEAQDDVRESQTLTTADRMMTGGFEANKGRLPMPITGNYKVVGHYGRYNVEGLSGVTLDNKGINIKGGAGCQARSVYDGEVSAVLGYGGTMVVMVRHGAFISVYGNLKSVSVSKGQRVSTRQGLGTVGTDNILQFRLYKETARLNPEPWLSR